MQIYNCPIIDESKATLACKVTKANAKVNIMQLIFCPLTYNGEVTKMT